MGFRRAIVPARSGASPDGLSGLTGVMEVREVEDVRHAVAAALAD